jgi:hypothetical protein
VGSIPITRWSLKSAHLAQSVEHFLGKEEVDGSIPLVGFDHKQKKRKQKALFLFVITLCLMTF